MRLDTCILPPGVETPHIMSTESTYVGTKLTPDEHRASSIKAAESGKSRSALLRDLARELINRPNGKPAKKKAAAEG